MKRFFDNLRFTKVMMLIVIMALAIGMMPNVSFAEAASTKLSVSSKTLYYRSAGENVPEDVKKSDDKGFYQSYTLKLKNKPTGKKVTWKSSDKKVATVSSKGKVTAVKNGTATITATCKGKSYKCKITVKKAGITVGSTANIEVGESFTLKIVGDSPDYFKTSDSSVVKVSSGGKITGKKAGKATVTAVCEKGSYKVKVTVEKEYSASDYSNNPQETPISDTGVKIYGDSSEMSVNQTRQLTAEVIPANASDKNVKWMSGATNVATVSESGLVKAISSGSVTIMAITANGNVGSIIIKVGDDNRPSNDDEVKSVKILNGNTSLSLSQKLQLYANVSPDNATNKYLTWTSSDSSIASISSSGLVTPVGVGKVIIVARANNGISDYTEIEIVDSTVPTQAPVVTSAPTQTPIVTSTPTQTPIVTSTPTQTPVYTPAPTSIPVYTPTPTQAPIITAAPTSAPVYTPAPTLSDDSKTWTEWFSEPRAEYSGYTVETKTSTGYKYARYLWYGPSKYSANETYRAAGAGQIPDGWTLNRVVSNDDYSGTGNGKYNAIFSVVFENPIPDPTDSGWDIGGIHYWAEIAENHTYYRYLIPKEYIPTEITPTYNLSSVLGCKQIRDTDGIGMCTIVAMTTLIRREQVVNGGLPTEALEEVANANSYSYNSAKGAYDCYGGGIKWENRYNISGNTYSTGSRYSENGVTAADIKNLLSSHPEGIMIWGQYDTNSYHAIIISRYENGTFYAYDPVNDSSESGLYSNRERKLSETWLMNKFGSEDSLFASVRRILWIE